MSREPWILAKLTQAEKSLWAGPTLKKWFKKRPQSPEAFYSWLAVRVENYPYHLTDTLVKVLIPDPLRAVHLTSEIFHIDQYYFISA